MAPPKRYDAIDFSPPQGVREAAKRGLEQRRKYGRGGLTTEEAGKQGIGSGVARAATLATGKAITPETAKRMKAFFARHGNAPQAKPTDGGPSARQIAINLWGGRAGEAWAAKLVRQMEAADAKLAKGQAPDDAAAQPAPLTFDEALAKARMPKLPGLGGKAGAGKPRLGGKPGGTFNPAKHPRAKDGKFARKGATVATYAKDKPLPKGLNGVPFKPWADAPTTERGWATVKGQNPRIAEPPLPEIPEGMKLGSGVIIREPDGRVWLTKPTGEFGGYKHTFPKGTAEEGLSLQANAIKEAFEETGLQVEIVGYAGDVKRTTSVGRYYYARRVGGSPAAHGWESEAVVLVPPAKLHDFLNMPLDQKMAHNLAGAPKPPPPPPPPPKPKVQDQDGYDELFTVKPQSGPWASKKPAGGGYQMGGVKEAASAAWKTKWGSMWNVKKGQGGAPIEGVRGFWDIYVPASEPIPFKAMLEAVTKALPKIPKLKGAKGAKAPKVGGKANYSAGGGQTIVGNLCRGPSGHFVACGVGGQPLHNINPKKWPTTTNNAAMNAAKHISAYEAAHKAGDLAGLLAIKPNMDALLPGKGNPYTKGKALVWQAAHDDLMAQKAGKAVIDAAAKPKSTAGWKKTGGQLGSNPGGKFMDPEGVQHYVKFSKSATHAQNEALATQLYALADSPAIPVTLVDDIPLGGKGLGTATKWETKSDFNINSAAHKALAHEDFATHAWLANWDAVGLKYDNLAMVNGKMTVLDTGGSLLFRAQGEPKGGLFGDVVAEWDTLRNPAVNAQSAKVFGDMDAAAMFNSAKKVANIPDEAITKVVLAHGPGSLADRQAMAARMIARKKDIIAKANGLGMGNVLDDGAKILPEPAKVATPKAPEPPKPAARDITPKAANAAGALTEQEAKDALKSAVPSWNSASVPMAGTPAAMLLQAAKTGDIPAIQSVPLGGAMGQKAKKAMVDAIEAKAAKAGGAAVAGGAVAGAAATAAGKKVVMSADEVMAAASKAAPSKSASGDWSKTQAKDIDGIKAAAAQGLDELEAFVPDSLVGAAIQAEAVAAMKAKAGGLGAGAAAGVAAAGATAAAMGAAKLSVKEAGDLLLAEMPGWKGPQGSDAMWSHPTWAKVKAGVEAGDIAAVKAAGAAFEGEPVALAAHKKLVAALEGGAGAAVADVAAAPAAMASQAVKTPPALPKALTVADLTSNANKPGKAMMDAVSGIQKAADDYVAGALNGAEALAQIDAVVIGGTNSYWKKVAKQKAAVMSSISQHAGIDAAAAAAAKTATKPVKAIGAVADAATTPSLAGGATTMDTLIQPPPPLLSKKPIGGAPKEFDPKGLTPPPSFMNWSGTGKPGPSSKLALNRANEKATQEIWALAQKGDSDGIKALKLDVLDITTGKIIGQATYDEHPSQWVKGFGSQVMAEIDNIKNPPPPINLRELGGIDEISTKYPAIAVADMPKMEKLGKYAKLGMAPTEQVEELFAKLTAPGVKKSMANKKLTTSTYTQQANEGFAKMPKVAREAIKGHTGIAYTDGPASAKELWAGNEHESVQAARSAVVTHGHYVEPGTLLSRKLNLDAQTIKDLQNSAGAVIFGAENGSSAIRPATWSGNFQWKITVGPNVKALWVSGNPPISVQGTKEYEMFIPSGHRLLVRRVYKNPGADADGFGVSASGNHPQWIGEAILLPNDAI